MLSANWFAVTLYGVQNIRSWFFVVVHMCLGVSACFHTRISLSGGRVSVRNAL